MIVELNKTHAVNIDNIFTCSKHTRIRKAHYEHEMVDSFRIFITTIHGSSDTIYFDTEEELNIAWIKITSKR